MNAVFGDCKDLPMHQNFAVFYQKQVENRGKQNYEKHALHAFENGSHRQFGNQNYRNQNRRRQHKPEVGFYEKYADDVHKRKHEFHSRVESVNDRIRGIILPEGNVSKHCRFPFLQP